MIPATVYGVLSLCWLAVIVLASTWPDGRSGHEVERAPGAAPLPAPWPERSSAPSIPGRAPTAGELDPDAPWCICGFANYSAGPCEVCGYDDQNPEPEPAWRSLFMVAEETDRLLSRATAVLARC